MANVKVLRFTRSDVDDGSVVARVERTGSPLDLRIVATEGENPYVGSVQQKNVSRLRASGYSGSDQEWEAIVLQILAQEQSPQASSVDGLETVASVGRDGLHITVRKNISGITQRLGSVSLNLKEEEEIDAVEWAAIAADAASAAIKEGVSLKETLESQQNAVRQLTDQLDDLIKAKEEHETQLLEKFSVLLNSKKQKIRDQNRVLASGKMDSTRAAQIDSARQGAGARRPKPSRTSKRKAKDGAAADPDSDSEFETSARANVDAIKEEKVSDEDMVHAVTPEPSSEAETEAGTEEDEADVEANASRSLPSISVAAGEGLKEREEITKVPPRRELPFTRKAAERERTHTPTAPEAMEQDEDEEL